MGDEMATIKASDVRVGDRLRTRLGSELTVTRIDVGFMGREGMIAFVEDSDEQWLKMPAAKDGEVTLVSRAGALSGARHFETPFAMEERLRAEGVTFDDEGRVRLDRHLWTPPTGAPCKGIPPLPVGAKDLPPSPLDGGGMVR